MEQERTVRFSHEELAQRGAIGEEYIKARLEFECRFHYNCSLDYQGLHAMKGGELGALVITLVDTADDWTVYHMGIQRVSRERLIREIKDPPPRDPDA
jgi:hypothetical protein